MGKEGKVSRRKKAQKVIKWIVLDVLAPIVSSVLDWMAYAEYAKDGELNGLVAPHTAVEIFYLVFCLIGTVILALRTVYQILVFLRLRELTWKESYKMWDQRDLQQRKNHKQSECLFTVISCHLYSRFRHGCNEDQTGEVSLKKVFDISEYWIEDERLDTLSIIFCNLPLRLLQHFALCRPRDATQVASAAFGAALAFKGAVTVISCRLWFPCRHEGFRSKRERNHNYVLLAIRLVLLLITVGFGAAVTFDPSEGLPDIYIYAHQSASTADQQPLAKLCYSRVRQDGGWALEAFQLSDIAWSGGHATCIVPTLTERVCSNGTSDHCMQWEEKPLYFTLQLNSATHKVYYQASVVHRNDCVAVNKLYSDNALTVVEHTRIEKEPVPLPELSMVDLYHRKFSGEAKQNGKCVINTPLQGQPLQVDFSCNAERHLTADICKDIPKLFSSARKYCEKLLSAIEKKLHIDP